MKERMQMPSIMYGTAWKKERTTDLVEQAILTGFRGIDTACQPRHYNEAGVGEALQRLKKKGIDRQDLFLQTKFTPVAGQDPQNIPYDPKADLTTQVQQSFLMSQKNLATDFMDSLVLHGPLETYKDTLQVWRAMEGLYKTGAVLRLGISNCYDPDLFKRLHEDADVKPRVLQNRFYRETRFDKELRMLCQEWQVTYQSFWTLKANPQILESQTVQDLKARYQKTEAQIFFRYLTQIGIVPLTGTTSEQHMHEDLEITGFQLNNDEKKAIESLLDI